MDTPFRINFRRSLLLSGAVSLGLIVLAVLTLLWTWELITTEWDKYGLLFIALPFSPLLIPALMVRREENQIQRRDETYPDFIRALGGTAQARSAEPSATIKALRGIDLVCLTIPSTGWKSDFRPGLILTGLGIISPPIPTSRYFSLYTESTSKGRSPLGNPPERLKWCQGVSVISSHFATAARFQPTPCGASLWTSYLKCGFVERHHLNRVATWRGHCRRGKRAG